MTENTPIPEPSSPAPGGPSTGAMTADGDPRAAVGHVTAGWRPVLGYWLLRYRRIWRSTAISSFLAPLMYLAGMGFGLGALVDSPGRTAIEGVAYVTFVATGLLAAQAMMSGVSEASLNVFGAIKWTFTYPAMLATPIRVVDVVRGHLAYILFRVTLVAGVFALVGTLLGAMTGWGVLAAVLVAVLCGMSFATCIFAFAAGAKSDTQGFTILQRFIVMPLFLFSGTFFPLEQLPGPLQTAAWISPLTHAVVLTRSFALEAWLPWWRVLLHTCVLVIIGVVGYLLSVRRLTRRMVV